MILKHKQWENALMSFSFQPHVKMKGKCVWGEIHFTALAKCPNSQKSLTNRTKFNSLNKALHLWSHAGRGSPSDPSPNDGPGINNGL